MRAPELDLPVTLCLDWVVSPIEPLPLDGPLTPGTERYAMGAVPA